MRNSISEGWAAEASDTAMAVAAQVADAEQAADEDAREELRSGMMAVAEPASPARDAGQVILVASVGNMLNRAGHWARAAVVATGKAGMAMGATGTLGHATGLLLLEIWPSILAFANVYWGHVPVWLELVKSEIERRNTWS